MSKSSLTPVRLRLLAAAAVLAAATTVPSLAEWQRIGSARVDDEYTRVHVGGMPSRASELSFKADADVRCADIRAEFDNGYTQRIYSGTLIGGRSQTIYFPEGSRRVTDVSLNCRSEDSGTARVALYADIDRRSMALSSPRVSIDGGLVPVAVRDFSDTAERSVMLPEARPAEEVAIQPVGGDARCSRISATFENGETRDAVPNDGGRLREGQIYRIDIADHPRDLNSIEMVCHATDTDNVNIRVFTST